MTDPDAVELAEVSTDVGLGEAARQADPEIEAHRERTIGRRGEPVRALMFSGGGFDTAMQLGVVHALLVTRARPPDVVLGISAGAVNAVALAEILQAGMEEHTNDPPAALRAKVERFRQIFEDFQNCPGDLVDAMLPDTYEIDTNRPLKPLRLPVQAKRERDFRREALASRSGLIELYNELMRLPLSVGTMTRAIRRVLGVRAAMDMPRRIRLPAILLEVFRLWMLLGERLHQIAPLLRPLRRALLLGGPEAALAKTKSGVSAARLIFRSRVWAELGHIAERLCYVILLAAIWIPVSLVVLALILVPIGVLGAGALWLLTAVVNTLMGLDLTTLPAAVLEAKRPGIGVAVGAVLAGALLFSALLGRRADLEWRNTLRVLLYFVVLIGAWGVVFIGATFTIARLLEYLAGLVGWMFGRPWQPALSAYFVAGAIVATALAFVLAVALRREVVRVNLLAIYHLADSLLNPHALRQFFVRMFDPGYYGDVDMDEVAELGIRRVERSAHRRGGGKRLGHYASQGDCSVHVALTVADLSTGRLRVLEDSTLVVDGLLAATAMTPLFPPVRISGGLCIDAANVATQATQALLDFLRPRIRIDATQVNIYQVSALPLSRQELGREPDKTSYNDLVQVASRALDLQRFRDASLDRKLTHIFTRSLPEKSSAAWVMPPPAAGRDGDGHSAPRNVFVRAWLYPVEPERPLRLNERLAEATDGGERRRIIAETVATGCRAAMQNLIGDHASKDLGPDGGQVSCGLVMATHPAVLAGGPLPGASQRADGQCPAGPGLAEVCRHCSFRLPDGGVLDRHLNIPPARKRPADWGRERAGGLRTPKAEANPPAAGQDWPRHRDGDDAKERPTISLLFSGGVFRGVYQMGVLNALNFVGIRPDLIAGASVGSLMAAMVARVFREEDEGERQARILRLAATYLTLDRMVLTDRFADFIRTLTIRAAGSRFSLREADRVFRLYDAALPLQFERELRRVVAGLERLFYVSPFELADLVEAIRRQRLNQVDELVRAHVREWLVRMGVGNQILGAEPLAQLIVDHVLDGLPGYVEHRAGSVPFRVFEEDGIHFLATTTNLTRGRLDVLGRERKEGEPEDQRAVLLDGLLASSAFPAVFRPRWSWEVKPGAREEEQYIDGGVTDNLPLDAVAQFLHRAAGAGRIAPRPYSGKVPHLLLCGSLEPRYRPLSAERQAELQFNWPALWTHARELRYNNKLDLYAAIQRNIRAVVRAQDAKREDILDLEVVAVKPEWLCSTFAFHPMLGYRRQRQARSIAHGCASTLLELGRRRAANEGEAWFKGWGIDDRALPAPDVAGKEGEYAPQPRANDNECWFVRGKRCPFSAEAVAEARLAGSTSRELVTIYRECGKLETHRPDRS